MMFFKWILLIALFKYSHEQTFENRIRLSPRKSKAPVTAALTTTTTTTHRLVPTNVIRDPNAPVEVILKFNNT